MERALPCHADPVRIPHMPDSGEPAPYEAQNAAAFVAALRRLKNASRLTYRQLSARAAERGEALSHSTLAGALNRVSLPRAELVSSFVRACGCTREEYRVWMTTHRRLSDGPATRADAVGPAPATPGGRQHAEAPAQLPAELAAFIGRQIDLDRILRAGPDPSTVAVVAIDGMAG